MAEKLTFQPQQPNNHANAPDIKFLNTLTKLEAEREEVEKQLVGADEEQKQFLTIRLEDLQKRIGNYHQSFGRYRKTEKLNNLTALAGERNVAEVRDFKSNKQPKTEVAGIGKNFLEDLKKFKKEKAA